MTLFGGVTGYFFWFCHGLLLMSRVSFGKIVTGNVTPYFGPQKCHGLLACHGLLFWKMSRVTWKMSRGKKKQWSLRYGYVDYVLIILHISQDKQRYDIFASLSLHRFEKQFRILPESKNEIATEVFFWNSFLYHINLYIMRL